MEGGPRSCDQSRSTGRGVHSHGELKDYQIRRRRETNVFAVELFYKEQSLKGLGVMVVTLETGRSSPGQGEVERKLDGGLKGC